MGHGTRVAAGDAGSRARACSIRPARTARGAFNAKGSPDLAWRTAGLPIV